MYTIMMNSDKHLTKTVVTTLYQGKVLQDQITEIDEVVDVATVDEVKNYLNI